MPESITVRAAAKVNLCLGVGTVRADGLHPLATVYQAIGMYDDVTVTDADDWSMQVTGHERIDLTDVPLDDSNIALCAGRLLTAHHGLDRAAALVIDKGIPVAGGLAGGSADAGAALLALDRLWALRTPDDVLLELAAQLGSDVPFALVGGTARGAGHGELVQRVDDTGSWWWVIVESDLGLSTPRIYAEFDRMHGADASTGQVAQVADPTVSTELLAALSAGDPVTLAAALSNDLQEAALHVRPDLLDVLGLGVAAGALQGIVSGSGPTCVFLCVDHDVAQTVRAAFHATGYERAQVAPGPVAGAHEVTYQ